jgi:hypothetical protein
MLGLAIRRREICMVVRQGVVNCIGTMMVMESLDLKDRTLLECGEGSVFYIDFHTILMDIRFF